jgi:hypothetical protein
VLRHLCLLGRNDHMNANKTLYRSCIDIILSRKVVFVPHVYDRVIK